MDCPASAGPSTCEPSMITFGGPRHTLIRPEAETGNVRWRRAIRTRRRGKRNRAVVPCPLSGHGHSIVSMTSNDIVPAAEILDPQECWRLLGEASVGRLAVIVDDHPDVFPVNYKVDNGSLVFRTGTGTKRNALDAGTPVAVEADSVSAERGTAWSVVVKGRAELETPAQQISEAVRSALFPWQGIGKDNLVRIVPESVTGRRFTLTPSIWSASLDDETRAGIEE